MQVRMIWFAGLAMFAASMAVAQKGAPAGTGTGGGGNPGGTVGGGGATTPSNTTNTNSPVSTPNSNSNTAPTQQRPIFINGQVLMEEGGPPPERVSIERTCAGGTYREGYTDSKGYFSLQLGSQNSMFADASMDTPMMMGNGTMSPQSNSMSQNNASLSALSTCELRASLPGFHSESVSLANRRSMDSGDIGVIILKRMVKVDGYSTSATIALAPKDARKAYEKGLNDLKHNKPDDAQTEFLRATELFPRHAGAWFELGKVYEQRDHLDQARDAYHKANAADANYVNPYERLYLLAMRDSQWSDAADLSDKVMRLNPYDFPSAYFYNALANVNLHRWDAAEKSAREAAKLRGTEAMPKSLFILGLVQANKGDLPGSVETLRSYLKTDPAATDKERAQKLLGQVQQDLDAKNQSAKAVVKHSSRMSQGSFLRPSYPPACGDRPALPQHLRKIRPDG